MPNAGRVPFPSWTVDRPYDWLTLWALTGQAGRKLLLWVVVKEKGCACGDCAYVYAQPTQSGTLEGRRKEGRWLTAMQCLPASLETAHPYAWEGQGLPACLCLLRRLPGGGHGAEVEEEEEEPGLQASALPLHFLPDRWWAGGKELLKEGPGRLEGGERVACRLP